MVDYLSSLSLSLSIAFPIAKIIFILVITTFFFSFSGTYISADEMA